MNEVLRVRIRKEKKKQKENKDLFCVCANLRAAVGSSYLLCGPAL